MIKSKLTPWVALLFLIVFSAILVSQNWKTNRILVNEVPVSEANTSDMPTYTLAITEELSEMGIVLGKDFPALALFLGDSMQYYKDKAIEKGAASLVGYYFEQEADETGDDSLYLVAAQYLIVGSNYVKIEGNRDVFLKKAQDLLNKFLEKNPNRLDAKSLLGYTFVRTEPAPMKGIGVLLDVLKEDSTQVDALFMLGEFSIESQQFEKALERFKKLLSLHPLNQDYFFKISEVFSRMGLKDSASHYLNLGKIAKEKNIKNSIN